MAKATHKSTRKSASPDVIAPAGSPTAWRIAREKYSPEVVAMVDAMLVKGPPTLADVSALQLAEIFRLLDSEEVTDADRQVASGLRHLRTIVKQMGGVPDVMARPVRVPDGMRGPRPKVEQRDLVKR